jgi:hypothetical protein
MEVNSNHTDATLHRNSHLIDSATGTWSGLRTTPNPELQGMLQGRRAAAAAAAKRVIDAVESHGAT